MDGLGALATVMLSGVVAAVSTYALNSSKEHIFHKRTKAEELYKAFDGWQGSLLDYFMRREMMLNGKLTLSEVTKIDLENKPENHFRDMQMLIGVYFPELAPGSEQLIARRTRLNSILSEVWRRYQDEPDSYSRQVITVAKFRDEYTLLIEAVENFRAAIVAQASVIATAESLLPAWFVAAQRRLRLRK